MNAANVVARLTPAGRAAIATLGIAGPLAWPTIRELFHPIRGSLPISPPPQAFWYGQFGTDVRDEVILTVESPERFTIHCHGGPQVVAWLLGLVRSRGFVEIAWSQWLAVDPSEPAPLGSIPWRRRLAALAEIHLARCTTLRTAAILLDQTAGALAEAVVQLADLARRGELAECQTRLDRLLDLGRLGTHLLRPWQVVLAGPPNVGKSSLINALLGYQRSIVADQPGTTRDAVTAVTAIDGWPVELCDTAGLRESADELESAGMALTRRRLAQAEWVLWLMDGSTEPVWPDAIPPCPIQLVVTKADLPASWDVSRVPQAVRVSVRSGEGLPELLRRFPDGRGWPDLQPGEAVPFTAALVETLTQARAALPDTLAFCEQLERLGAEPAL